MAIYGCCHARQLSAPHHFGNQWSSRIGHSARWRHLFACYGRTADPGYSVESIVLARSIRRLTFDMSCGRRAQPVGRQLDGMVGWHLAILQNPPLASGPMLKRALDLLGVKQKCWVKAPTQILCDYLALLFGTTVFEVQVLDCWILRPSKLRKRP